MDSLLEVYCRLGKTQNGVGVVAIREIPKGTNPFKNCNNDQGKVEVPQAELDAYDAPDAAKQLIRDFCPLVGGVYLVPHFGIEQVDKSYFLNHSASANLVTEDEGDTFVAARNIQAGEELTANYDSYHDRLDF